MIDIPELFGNANGYSNARNLFDAFVSQSNFDKVFHDACGFDYDFVVGNYPYERFVYQMLKNYYRNDFFIRYTFFDKILSRKKAVSFFEMPITSSRIDMASINGISVGYEIKTEYDTFQRLEKQIVDYSKLLEYVYVVCPNSSVDQILRIIPGYCGIYCYDEKRSNSSFKIAKEAEKSPNLNSSTMLQCMLKDELKDFFQDTKVELIDERYSFDEINKVFKRSLKKRYASKMMEIENKVNLMMG